MRRTGRCAAQGTAGTARRAGSLLVTCASSAMITSGRRLSNGVACLAQFEYAITQARLAWLWHVRQTLQPTRIEGTRKCWLHGMRL